MTEHSESATPTYSRTKNDENSVANNSTPLEAATNASNSMLPISPPLLFPPYNASLPEQFQQLGCLKHPIVSVNARFVSNKTARVRLTMKMREGCGPLRRDWRYNPPLSPLAQQLLQQQSNCSLPFATWDMNFGSGIGAHVIGWSRSMCYAWEHNMRLRSYRPKWVWMDRTHCDVELAKRSPWLCYFPKMELSCPTDDALIPALQSPPQQPASRVLPLRATPWSNTNNSDNLNRDNSSTTTIHRYQPCQRDFSDKGFIPAYRAATVEFIFHYVSALVIQEAQRQIGILFGPNGAPEDLITVHVRWGDKFAEMELVPIAKYINAVHQLLKEKNQSSNNSHNGDNIIQKSTTSVANIYVATEDPAAVTAFIEAAPKTWNIFTDVSVEELSPFRPPSTLMSCATQTAKNTVGRSGLLSLGSLLVGMEANHYVLSTGSSYGRLINALRTNVVDPRCGNCTRLVDVQPGDWK